MNIERDYERIKSELMVSEREREAINREVEESSFMRASRRNVAKVVGAIEAGPEMPGERSMMRLAS